MSIALGVIALLSMGAFIDGADLTEITVVIIFAAFALSLRFSQNSVVAALILALTSLPPVLTIAVGLIGLGADGLALWMLGLGALWSLLPLACFRAFKATRALRNLPPEVDAETFS